MAGGGDPGPAGEHPHTLCCWAFQLCCSQAALVLSLKGPQGPCPQPCDPQRGETAAACAGELLCPGLTEAEFWRSLKKLMHLQPSSGHLQASLALEGWPVPSLSRYQRTRLGFQGDTPGLSLPAGDTTRGRSRARVAAPPGPFPLSCSRW